MRDFLISGINHPTNAQRNTIKQIPFSSDGNFLEGILLQIESILVVISSTPVTKILSPLIYPRTESVG